MSQKWGKPLDISGVQLKLQTQTRELRKTFPPSLVQKSYRTKENIKRSDGFSVMLTLEQAFKAHLAVPSFGEPAGTQSLRNQAWVTFPLPPHLSFLPLPHLHGLQICIVLLLPVLWLPFDCFSFPSVGICSCASRAPRCGPRKLFGNSLLFWYGHSLL